MLEFRVNRAVNGLRGRMAGLFPRCQLALLPLYPAEKFQRCGSIRYIRNSRTRVIHIKRGSRFSPKELSPLYLLTPRNRSLLGLVRYVGAENPAPRNPRSQRRGGFWLGLARGDRSGCLRNSSAVGCSRCSLSLFAGPARRLAQRRRGH
jgi:hypothetical protein